MSTVSTIRFEGYSIRRVISICPYRVIADKFKFGISTSSPFNEGGPEPPDDAACRHTRACRPRPHRSRYYYRPYQAAMFALSLSPRSSGSLLLAIQSLRPPIEITNTRPQASRYRPEWFSLNLILASTSKPFNPKERHPFCLCRPQQR